MTRPWKGMKLGMFNVRGLRFKAPEVDDWIEDEGINIAAITETKIRPGFHTGISLPHEHTPAFAARNNSNNNLGGVALILHGVAKYKVVYRYRTAKIQALGVRIKDVTFVGIYIQPNIGKEEYLKVLNHLHFKCRGTVIVMGDFNTHHREWGTYTNNAGRWLVTWATQRAWTIDAPSIPTRYAPDQSSSILDIAITRNCKAHGFKYAENFCMGISDHLPISFYLDKSPKEPEGPPRISLTRRTKQVYLDEVEKIIDRDLDAITDKLPQINTQAEMDELHRQVVDMQVAPFMPKGKLRSRRRNKFFWTPELSMKAKERNSLYKTAILTDDTDDWLRYLIFDRDFKREIKRVKRKTYIAFLESLEDDLDHDSPGQISRMCKARRKRAVRTTLENAGELKLEEFTEHVATKFPPSPVIIGERFEFDEVEMEQDILYALLHSARKKAAGVDMVFNETLQLNAPKMARFLTQLWKACGRLGITPSMWDKILLFPIYKKGPRNVPNNYRPISLMSHIRKVIEKAIDRQSRRAAEFAASQCGFRPFHGTDNALLRYTHAMNLKQNKVAVLDIKGAFPSVPRDRLMNVIRQRLSPTLAKMISHFLKPTQVSTVGDPTGKTAIMYTGVPEGGAISPFLFNLYIDPLAGALLRVGIRISLFGVIVYADDIILMAGTMRGLQKLLDMCTEWAAENQITFGIDKCYALYKGKARRPKLSGQKLKRTNKTVYLGTNITCTGISPSTITKRVNAMYARIQELTEMGYYRYIHPRMGRLLFRTLLKPVMDYALHLVPVETKQAEKALASAASAEFRALGSPLRLIDPRPRNRLLTIYGQYDIYTRRKIAASKLWARLEEGRILARENGDVEMEYMKDAELEALSSLYSQDTLKDPTGLERHKRRINEARKDRKINQEPEEEHPAMNILPRSLARMSLLYHFGRYLTPDNKDKLGKIFGSRQVNTWREELRQLFRQPKLDQTQRDRLIELLYVTTDYLDKPPRQGDCYPPPRHRISKPKWRDVAVKLRRQELIRQDQPARESQTPEALQANNQSF